jgi:hypothetical protein
MLTCYESVVKTANIYKKVRRMQARSGQALESIGTTREATLDRSGLSVVAKSMLLTDHFIILTNEIRVFTSTA